MLAFSATNVAAAESIGHLGEPVEADQSHVVDPDVEQLLHCSHEQRRTAIPVGSVALALAVARHVDVEVAREVHGVDGPAVIAVTVDVRQDDDV